MNVDAANDRERGLIGVCAVIRNSDWEVMAALPKNMIRRFSARDMEAKALYQSLIWAQDVVHIEEVLELVESRLTQPLSNEDCRLGIETSHD
ncbi:hypothetical protein TorRG33x02_243860 [Trema orientale]|uniref:RNase H type-1 domain-containing protein n=1 Tax=Trema orientale TaxID=63057 RepID=A0A2P5DRR2_TREOI|nr:hypothetical protein TorRG33x02_243860 [Trema orientale]